MSLVVHGQAKGVRIPIGERHVVAAVERLEEADHPVGVIELEIDVLEEVLAQDEIDTRERPFAAYPHAKVLAHHAPDLDFLDPRGEDAGGSSKTGHPIGRAARLEAEALGRRIRDEARGGARIDQHPDLLAVDLAFSDGRAVAQPHRPFGDPHEFALHRLRRECRARERQP